MNTDKQNINLLRTQSTLSPEEITLLSRLKIVCFFVVVFICICGLFVGTAYLAAKLRIDNLTIERSNTMRQLTLNSRKEAMLVALKQRIPVVDLAIKKQYSWDKIIEFVTYIVNPPILKSLSIDESYVLTLTIEANSLDEIKEIVQKTEELTIAKKIKNSRIQSLDSNKDGKVNTLIMFTPVL
jgi:hypothetical protein